MPNDFYTPGLLTQAAGHASSLVADAGGAWGEAFKQLGAWAEAEKSQERSIEASRQQQERSIGASLQQQRISMEAAQQQQERSIEATQEMEQMRLRGEEKSDIRRAQLGMVQDLLKAKIVDGTATGDDIAAFSDAMNQTNASDSFRKLMSGVVSAAGGAQAIKIPGYGDLNNVMARYDQLVLDQQKAHDGGLLTESNRIRDEREALLRIPGVRDGLIKITEARNHPTQAAQAANMLFGTADQQAGQYVKSRGGSPAEVMSAQTGMPPELAQFEAARVHGTRELNSVEQDRLDAWQTNATKIGTEYARRVDRLTESTLNFLAPKLVGSDWKKNPDKVSDLMPAIRDMAMGVYSVSNFSGVGQDKILDASSQLIQQLAPTPVGAVAPDPAAVMSAFHAVSSLVRDASSSPAIARTLPGFLKNIPGDMDSTTLADDGGAALQQVAHNKGPLSWAKRFGLKGSDGKPITDEGVDKELTYDAFGRGDLDANSTLRLSISKAERSRAQVNEWAMVQTGTDSRGQQTTINEAVAARGLTSATIALGRLGPAPDPKDKASTAQYNQAVQKIFLNAAAPLVPTLQRIQKESGYTGEPMTVEKAAAWLRSQHDIGGDEKLAGTPESVPYNATNLRAAKTDAEGLLEFWSKPGGREGLRSLGKNPDVEIAKLNSLIKDLGTFPVDPETGEMVRGVSVAQVDHVKKYYGDNTTPEYKEMVGAAKTLRNNLVTKAADFVDGSDYLFDGAGKMKPLPYRDSSKLAARLRDRSSVEGLDPREGPAEHIRLGDVLPDAEFQHLVEEGGRAGWTKKDFREAVDARLSRQLIPENIIPPSFWRGERIVLRGEAKETLSPEAITAQLAKMDNRDARDRHARQGQYNKAVGATVVRSTFDDSFRAANGLSSGDRTVEVRLTPKTMVAKLNQEIYATRGDPERLKALKEVQTALLAARKEEMQDALNQANLLLRGSQIKLDAARERRLEAQTAKDNLEAGISGTSAVTKAAAATPVGDDPANNPLNANPDR